MAKFNTRDLRAPRAKGAMQTKTDSTGAPVVTQTFNGGQGYVREAKSEVFLLAAGSFVMEDAYYEKGNARTQRYVQLLDEVTKADPEWVAAFLTWLRGPGNIRTAAIVGAVEVAERLAKAGVAGGRQLISAVLQRADEPGEMLAYWIATRGRKTLPKPIKRGIADAVERLYTEYALLKYDTDRVSVRFGDVIEIVHPGASSLAQGHLYEYAIERRRKRGTEPDASLTMVRTNGSLRETFKLNPAVLLDADNLKAAGMTWEDTLSLAGDKVSKRDLWAALAPNLPYMAAIRNLRNIDEAGVLDKDVASLITRIADPRQVAKSRQLPYRFWQAFKAAPSLRWGHALDTALNLSLANIPVLGGKTLVLIDTSASMQAKLSAKSEMSYVESAAIFGLALALRGQADVFGWATGAFGFVPKQGVSLLTAVAEFDACVGRAGHDTNMAGAFAATYKKGVYSRVVVISDMQINLHYGNFVPKDIPVYFFNLAGYRAGVADTKSNGNVYDIGGLGDSTFNQIKSLEAGKTGAWPWENQGV